ncbi:hypothetical protein RHGRI_038721 [Rhododendron griersonianum]|uniref:Protein kinase domain-containing protein n=1 Tax=Rhododendron griersonianum TaxID=479676 RepID=A0AAV6HLH0_9ERIC|nr:hypothetical protein RHGRI_038721 [Rhododendron griersonianum]
MEKNPFVQAGALSTDLATNDFDDALVIGTGGFGKVYKANIDDGATTTVVAIKRLSAKSKQGAEEFWTQLKLLSKLRHANLVSLIGYCNENQEMIIVYEYMAQGTLANHLYKTSTREESGGSRSHLTWEQRLNICLDAACGLDYLHNGTLQGIIHGDVKSTNILLDKHLVAKVSDLGLSKSTTHTATHNSTYLKRTIGYLDPMFCRPTKKSDVYSFGVVLLEVLCGRPAIDEERMLSHWAQMNIKEGTLDRIIDPYLNGDTTPDILEYFAELAYKCVHIQPKERPVGNVNGLGGYQANYFPSSWWEFSPLHCGGYSPIDWGFFPHLLCHLHLGRSQGTFAKAFDDFKAQWKETFMIHQENIVKKDEGFINEHLPDHVFECQVQAGSGIESTSTYDRSGITQSLSSASEMENLTKSALSLDDSTKPRSLPDFDATENKAVKVYTSWGRGCWHPMEELEQGTTLEELGMDPENEDIISDLLRFVSDKEEFYKKASKDWKRGYLLYDAPSTNRSSLIAAISNFLEFDIYHLDLSGLTSISEMTNVLVSIRNRFLIAIKDFDQWAGKLPDFKTEKRPCFCEVLTLKPQLRALPDQKRPCFCEVLTLKPQLRALPDQKRPSSVTSDLYDDDSVLI